MTINQDLSKDESQTHTSETENQGLNTGITTPEDPVSQKIKKEVSSNELKVKNNSFQSCFLKTI